MKARPGPKGKRKWGGQKGSHMSGQAMPSTGSHTKTLGSEAGLPNPNREGPALNSCLGEESRPGSLRAGLTGAKAGPRFSICLLRSAQRPPHTPGSDGHWLCRTGNGTEPGTQSVGLEEGPPHPNHNNHTNICRKRAKGEHSSYPTTEVPICKEKASTFELMTKPPQE